MKIQVGQVWRMKEPLRSSSQRWRVAAVSKQAARMWIMEELQSGVVERWHSGEFDTRVLVLNSDGTPAGRMPDIEFVHVRWEDGWAIWDAPGAIIDGMMAKRGTGWKGLTCVGFEDGMDAGCVGLRDWPVQRVGDVLTRVQYGVFALVRER